MKFLYFIISFYHSFTKNATFRFYDIRIVVILLKCVEKCKFFPEHPKKLYFLLSVGKEENKEIIILNLQEF